MSADRELLDLAAKVAGIGPLDFDYAEREGHGFYFGPRLPMPQGVVMAAMWTYWNPLDNDGDAFRLAVKLRLSVCAPSKGYRAFVQTLDLERGQSANCGDDALDTSDPAAATRRAIVRCAAAIAEDTDCRSRVQGGNTNPESPESSPQALSHDTEEPKA